LEWQAETAQDYLLRAMKLRFETVVPPDLAKKIREQSDYRKLAQWFDLAMTSGSLATFRQKIGLTVTKERRSQQVLEWQAEASHATILRLYELRFHALLPEDLENVLRKLIDPDELSLWVDAVATAESPDAFRTGVSQTNSSEMKVQVDLK